MYEYDAPGYPKVDFDGVRTSTAGLWFLSPGGEALNKVLYGEAPPRGPYPYSFIYYFSQKRYPFRISSIETCTSLTYLRSDVD